ncbi:MAG: DMT family transporter [Pseudomonadota bacterium]
MTHFLDGTTEDRPGLAAGLMLTALMMLAVQDSLARLAGLHISFWQFQAMRASGNIVLLTLMALILMGRLPPLPRRPLAVGARVFMMILTTIFFFGGIPEVSIVEMAAGLYTYPIFVTLLSATFLREKIGLRRIAAVAVGATGAMLILQPGAAEFSPIKLMPVAAGFCYAVNVIITRRFCRGENALTMAGAIAVSFVVLGVAGCIVLAYLPVPEDLRQTFPYLTYGWREPMLWIVGITVICSLINASANVALTKAYQSAESSWLAPFDYSYLVFAALAGIVFFGTIPGPYQVAGMCLIAGAGAFTAWRERRLKAALARGLGTEVPPPGNRG